MKTFNYILLGLWLYVCLSMIGLPIVTAIKRRLRIRATVAGRVWVARLPRQIGTLAPHLWRILS